MDGNGKKGRRRRVRRKGGWEGGEEEGEGWMQWEGRLKEEEEEERGCR